MLVFSLTEVLRTFCCHHHLIPKTILILIIIIIIVIVLFSLMEVLRTFWSRAAKRSRAFTSGHMKRWKDYIRRRSWKDDFSFLRYGILCQLKKDKQPIHNPHLQKHNSYHQVWNFPLNVLWYRIFNIIINLLLVCRATTRLERVEADEEEDQVQIKGKLQKFSSMFSYLCLNSCWIEFIHKKLFFVFEFLLD